MCQGERGIPGERQKVTMSKFVAVTPAFPSKTSDDSSSSEVTTANSQGQYGKCLDAHSTSVRNADNDDQSCSEKHHNAVSTIANIKAMGTSGDSEQQDFWLAPPVQVTQEGM